MNKVAIMVDGGFYRVRANQLFGARDKSPSAWADELEGYCRKHAEKSASEGHPLYRIFYYDCQPVVQSVYHPLRKETVDLSKSPTFKRNTEFFEELKKRSRFAIRRGMLSAGNCCYLIKPTVQKAILRGNFKIENLSDRDIRLDVGQKGVDMRLGLDLVSLALKRIVDQVVLVTGDSDFVPAIKMARREGVEIVLDSMGMHIADDLREHVDDVLTFSQDVEK